RAWNAGERCRGIGEHGSVARRDAKTGSKPPLPGGYLGLVMGMSRDGKRVAVGDKVGRIDIWEAEGRHVATLQTSGPEVLGVAFSPDGSKVAVSDRNRLVRIWSIGTGREVQRFTVPADHEDLFPVQLTFSPDGQRILVNHGLVMALWDLNAKTWLW